MRKQEQRTSSLGKELQAMLAGLSERERRYLVAGKQRK